MRPPIRFGGQGACVFKAEGARMTDDRSLDSLFCEAVAAIDAGDLPRLSAHLRAHRRLPCERLDSPGSWLRDKIGPALDSFFSRPYLLWFVAEDPVRAGRLPPNIAELAAAIVQAAARCDGPALQEQLAYAVTLVAWSGVAAREGCQIPLLDVLAEAGADLAGRRSGPPVAPHRVSAHCILDHRHPVR